MTGFGVYGRAENNSGSVKWAIFDIIEPHLPFGYSGASQQAAQSGITPALNLTMPAGHKYSMALWHSHVRLGTKLPAHICHHPEWFDRQRLRRSRAYPEHERNGVGTGPRRRSYAGYFHGLFGFRTSLQGLFRRRRHNPPIPEPSEWAMLLAGLMVVGFVAKRQRRRTSI